MTRYISDLDAPLLRLSPVDYFTVLDAMQSVAVFGGTGSGKTSASGKALASAYLRAGWGCVVLCAKPDEISLWQDYAKKNGRGHDVVLFGEGGGGGFNFIDYEMAAQGLKGTTSVTECIMKILEAERVVMPGASGSSEPFWERSSRQLLNNTLPMLFSAYGKLKLEEVYDFITSGPTRPEHMESDGAWQTASFMFRTVQKAADAPAAALDRDEAMKILRYWTGEFAQLDAKTRGNIVVNLSSALDRFLRGRLRDHFCRATTVTPEMTMREGKVIIMAMPSLSWNEDGLIAQHLFKYMWQRAVLRRSTMPEDCRHRPVFLFADEAQNFINGASDADFQAQCRSSSAGTIYLSQNMPSYVAAMGGTNGKPLADKLLGNFGTKVWHSNADPETNRWAAETIGRRLTVRNNYSNARSQVRSHGKSKSEGASVSSTGGYSRHLGGTSGGSSSSTTRGNNDSSGSTASRSDSESRSEGGTEVMDFAVEPRVFAHELRKGGKRNGLQVDAVWFQYGRPFHATDCAFLPVTFRQ